MVCLQSDAPRVSVVMCVHNGAQYLRAAIDSILTQSFRDFEFLIVDDGSTDGTPSILRDAAAGDARITIICQEHRKVARSLNRGISLARGQYIARQDGDDISLPDRLSKQVAFLDAHPDVALVGTFATAIDGQGGRMGEITLPVDHDEIRRRMFERYSLLSCTFLMRRAAVLEAGGYRMEFPVAQDTDLEHRLSERFKVANIPEPLYLYRRSESSISIRNSQLKHLYEEIAKELARQRAAEGRDILNG